MLHSLFFGLLLGWGIAIPIGPMNLEIIRRNLRLGSSAGLSFGLGVCSADVTYLILLSLGVFSILIHPLLLKIVGLIGALVLAWFGFSALRLKSETLPKSSGTLKLNNRSVLRHWLEGYAATLFNPMTILFWSSLSTTVTAITHHSNHATLYAGIGVFLGTTSWTCTLNTVLHFTRHRLSSRAMQYLNYTGGIILLGFAAFSVWHVM